MLVDVGDPVACQSECLGAALTAGARIEGSSGGTIDASVCNGG